jgi:hypothetical protein
MDPLPRFGRPLPPDTDETAGRPRPGTVLAGAAAALILAGAGAVALFGGSSPPPAVPAAAGPAVPPAEADEADEAGEPATAEPARPAQLEADGAEPLLTAPPVSWQLFFGVALPHSPTAGPRGVDGPVYAGYQRSQAGALIAAAQLGTRYLLTPGDGWREVAEQQVLPGVGRDVFLAARAQVDDLDVPPGTYGQLAGFRIVTFTPDVAVISFVSRFSLTGQLQVTTTTVKWTGGDWRLELQPDGGPSPTAQTVPDLDGFVVWGGA